MSHFSKLETIPEGNKNDPVTAKDVIGGASTEPVKSNGTTANDKATLVGKVDANGDKKENNPITGNGVVSKDEVIASKEDKKDVATDEKEVKPAGENGKAEGADEDTVKFPPFALIPRAIDSGVPGALPGFPYVFDVVPARLLSPSTSLANTSAGPGSARPDTPFALLPMEADPCAEGAVPELPYTWKPVPYNVLDTHHVRHNKKVDTKKPSAKLDEKPPKSPKSP